MNSTERIKKLLEYLVLTIILFIIFTLFDLLFAYPVELGKNFVKVIVSVLITIFFDFTNRKKWQEIILAGII